MSCSEISCSARKIRSEENIPREDFAGAAAAAAVGVTAVPPHVRDNRDSTCRSGKSHEESRIRENPANSRNQRDESDHETTNDAAEPRTSLGNAGLWGRDMADSVQWELRNYELSHRLMLHRLETEEKRLKVKIAEMAIQEIRFRIRALNEDIRRADELHELHLALATAQAVSRVGSANTILQKRIHRDTVIRSQWLH
ncbi:uncharacterized protein LOC109610761 [Ooceraea biroi]|nr:uncharacterized protein LOC109610761 [Ooceraea biroi]